MFQSKKIKRKKYLARFLLSLLVFSSLGTTGLANNQNISYADNQDGVDVNSEKKDEDNKKKDKEIDTEKENQINPSDQNGYEKDLDTDEGRELIRQSILELGESAEKGAEKVANALNEIANDPKKASAKAKSYLVALKNHINEKNIAKLLGSKLINNGAAAKIFKDKTLKQLLSQLLPQSVYNNILALVNNAMSSNPGSNIESNIASSIGLSGKVFPHTMSDLLSSVIFSLNEKDGKADSARISFSDLERYPADSDGLQIYGRLQAPRNEDKSTSAGRDLVSYLHTIYGFDYLVPIPKSSSEAKTFSGFLYCLFHEGKEAGAETVFGKMLTTAKWGASLYDVAISGINMLSDLLPKFDFLALLGLTDSKSPDGLITKLYEVIANTLGLSKGWIQILTRLIVLFMTTALFIQVMLSLAKSVKDRTTIFGKFKRWGLRILVILFLVPVTTVMRGVIDDVTNDLISEKTIISDFNNKYVLDTLTWAATTNLSLSPINGGNIASGTEDGDFGSFNRRNWNFKPTPENIGRLNDVVNAKAREAGISSENLTYKDDKGEVHSIVRNQASTASELFEKLSSKETVNVNDYLAMVRRVGNTNNVVAASFTPIGKNFSLGDGFNKKKFGTGTFNQIISPFFLEKKEGLEENKDSQASDGDDSSKKYTFKIAGKEFKINQDSPIKPTYISWHNLAYYIYGANSISSTSKEQATFYNFIYGTGTKQNVSPEDGNIPSEDKVKQAMNLNAASIALMNRYSGITKIGGSNMASLSTQSVVFLLQSHSAGGNLDYSGINTSPSESGKTKNAGVTGNKFVRYVIPNSGKWDVMYKIGLLSTTWISAGFTAAFVLLYLFRCGFIGMFWKMFKNFIVAQTTGNIVSAMDFLVYYTAIKLTFVFAKLGLNFGTWVLSVFLNMVPALSTSLAIDSGVKGLFNSIPLIGKITSFIPPTGVLLLAPFICLVLTWPTFIIKLGSKNTPRKVSALELVVNGGYLLAEACEEYLDTFHRRIFGKSRSQTFGAKLKNQVQTVDQKEVLKAKGSQLAKAGLAAATGGMSMAGGLGALGGKAAMTGSTIGSALGQAGSTVANNFKENGAIGGLQATFTNAKDKVKDTITGNVSGGNADDYGMEMPKRGNLDSFFNAKKNINNRTDIYGNDLLHFEHDKFKDTKSVDDRAKDGVKDDALKNNVQNDTNTKADNQNIEKSEKLRNLNTDTKDKNLNPNSSDLDSVLTKHNNEFSKQVSDFKASDDTNKVDTNKVDTNKVTSKDIETDNIKASRVSNDANGFEKPKNDEVIKNRDDKISEILNKKDSDFAQKAMYGMDNFSHNIANKMAKSYKEAIPEFRNVLSQRETLKDQANELKVKVDNGTASDVEKSTYKAYAKEIRNLDKQVENFKQSFGKADTANQFYTNLGNKINELQDSRIGKFSGTVSRIIRDNLQSDGKGDRAAKYIEKVESLENQKMNAPYIKENGEHINPKKYGSSKEEDLSKLIKEMMQQNAEHHEEMLKATSENTNVLDQLGLNTKEGL